MACHSLKLFGARSNWSATEGESQVGQVFFGVPVQPPTRNLLEFRSETPDEANGQSQRRCDEEIRLAVVTALHWDLAVPRDSVEVTVKGGWVTLTGQVRRAYEKSCAEADARMASGVIGVINEIGCKPA
jgi:osmotically-inducible protein OsmY